MSAHPTDILIAKAGGREALAKIGADARVMLAKKILKGIARPGEPVSIGQDQQETLVEALRLVEMRCLDLASAWRRDSKSGEGVEFREFASLAFEIRRVLPPEPDAVSRVKAALHLAASGCLGDRTADVRRYLNENPWPVEQEDLAEADWPRRVLFQVAEAFLKVIRKQNWHDLHEVAAAIRALREWQGEFEAAYLAEANGVRQTAALELVAFYQLAKGIEVLGEFTGTGQPRTALDDVEFHFSRAVKAADAAGIIELALLLRWLGMAARTLIRATIWHLLGAYNHQMTAFKKALTDERNLRPMFELLPPQREAIQEVMNIGNRALVVEMPTSSGKTLLAEFRMIQTKVNYTDAWIAYLAPTRALVNQLTNRLRRDLAPLGMQVEQATPAFELDALELELLESEAFDILVTTPEKLDLIIRSGAGNKRPLGLVILDEAHNLAEGERGLRSELLLATINRESPDTHFLLLTPFVPNAKELATWLDDERSRTVTPSLAIDWQPNDRLIGLGYPQGRARVWGLELKPLHVTQSHRAPVTFPEAVSIAPEKQQSIPYSQAKSSKIKVAALLAEALANRGGSIVLAYSPRDCWNLAGQLAERLPERRSEKIDMVRAFVAAECGSDFALHHLLGHGIGVHHGGVPPEVRALLEWLMEEEQLEVLVATTTLAQGVNFPISNVILATNRKPLGTSASKPMGPEEFWNIAGRAGRLYQDSLGLVLFASGTSEDRSIEEYVNVQVSELASALEEMLLQVRDLGWELDLRRLVRNDAKWSSFVQFLSHAYRQTGDHARFLADTEKLLKRTFAYHRLSEREPELAEQLLESTRTYAEELSRKPGGVTTLVDLTGFSAESITELLKEKDSFALPLDDWSPSRLFQSGGPMKDLIGAMLTVPELNLPDTGQGDTASLAGILQMWVEGKPVREIADAYFSHDGDLEKRLTECCRRIFQKLTHQAAWGVGALQAMSDLELSKLPPETAAEVRSIPSMIYYGVPTVSAVLMRSLGVPRSMSVALGSKFSAETEIQPGPRLQKARSWLASTPSETWSQLANEMGLAVEGKVLHRAWSIISGQDNARNST